MSTPVQWIITVLGRDRPGLVDRLSEWVAEAEGDWLDSHLTQVGDHFAGILQVSTPGGKAGAFEKKAPQVSDQTGLALKMERTGKPEVQGTLFAMTCMGQDRPGIVKALTDIFLEVGANVETLDTSYQDAPMSGEQLFEAQFQVRLPSDVNLSSLEERLSGIGEELMLDVQVSN